MSESAVRRNAARDVILEALLRVTCRRMAHAEQAALSVDKGSGVAYVSYRQNGVALRFRVFDSVNVSWDTHLGSCDVGQAIVWSHVDGLTRDEYEKRVADALDVWFLSVHMA